MAKLSQGISRITLLLLGLFLPCLLSSCDPQAYERGFDQGIEEGYQTGWSQGKAEGYRQGRDDGYAIGKREGFKKGQQAFIDDSWVPSLALGACFTLVCLSALASFHILKKPCRAVGVFLLTRCKELFSGVQTRWELRRVRAKLKAQEKELLHTLLAQTEWRCLVDLRQLWLEATEEEIQTKFRELVHEVILLPELKASLHEHTRSIARSVAQKSRESEVSNKCRLTLLQDFHGELDRPQHTHQHSSS